MYGWCTDSNCWSEYRRSVWVESGSVAVCIVNDLRALALVYFCGVATLSRKPDGLIR